MTSIPSTVISLFSLPRISPRASICPQCLHRINRTTAQTACRNFTTTQLLFEDLKPSKRSTARPAFKAKTRALPVRPSYVPDQAFDPSQPTDLANNPSRITPALLNAQLRVPTVVYVAPSHTAYNIAGATGGLFFAGYGLHAIQMSWLYPPDVLSYVTYGTSIAGAFMVLIGCWWSAAMLRVVKRITLIPQGRLNPPSPLLAKLEVTKLLPFRRHTIEVQARELSLVRSMESTELPELKIEPEGVPIILKPFVWLRKATLIYFRETRNTFMREHMIGLVVPNKGNFKVDNRGLAFGGARGLDKVFPARGYAPGSVLYRD